MTDDRAAVPPEHTIRRARDLAGSYAVPDAPGHINVLACGFLALLAERDRAVAEAENDAREHAREVEALWAERDRYREALERIAADPVAAEPAPIVGGLQRIARAALAVVRDPQPPHCPCRDVAGSDELGQPDPDCDACEGSGEAAVVRDPSQEDSHDPTQRVEATTTPEGGEGWETGQARHVDPARGHGVDVAPDPQPEGVRAETRRPDDSTGGEPGNSPTADPSQDRETPADTEGAGESFPAAPTSPEMIFRFKIGAEDWNWPVEGEDSIRAFREILMRAQVGFTVAAAVRDAAPPPATKED